MRTRRDLEMKGDCIMATSKKTQEIVEIKPIKKTIVPVRIVGDSPLIMHCWDAKAKRQILESEVGIKRAKGDKEKKNPVEDFVSSMYWLNPMPNEMTDAAVDTALQTAKFGFPLSGFKQAAISAAYRMGWVKDKMSLRGAFFIEPSADGYYAGDLQINEARTAIQIVPNVYHREPMIEIKSDMPIMRQDMVKVGMGSADIRYRGEFRNWYAEFMLSFNENGSYSLEHILNFINAGGYVCGVGEWRPERDGQYGMYHVQTME